MEDLCTKLTQMFEDQLTYDEFMAFTTEELTGYCSKVAGFDGRIEQIENSGPTNLWIYFESQDSDDYVNIRFTKEDGFYVSHFTNME